MADIEQDFETRENRLMRAWMHYDPRALKSLISNDFIFMFGTTPPALLDRASFMAGIENGFRCLGFRFHEVTARKHGKGVWFSGHIELEMRIGAREWNGKFLMTDLWRKGIVRRRWQLAERSLSLLDGDERLSDSIRSMQLWR